MGHAGILFSLPALLVNGLLKFVNKNFSIPKGYYDINSLFLTLAFCALLRIKSLEQVRYCPVGELGKSVGLDRIPEVKTLREKIKYMSTVGNPTSWGKELSKYWMEEEPSMAGTLYVDGHVRVYHGEQTKLPRRYVSREKLCLRGVTDYWVNDSVGSPFFVVSKVVNQGLLDVLKKDIIPRLLLDIPNQPSQHELEQSKYLYRFCLVFDREGYSPVFFKDMWESHRIACYTYKKNVTDIWPSSDFEEYVVTSPNGEKSEMRLAERGSNFPDADVWLREIRSMSDTGHQTTIITSDYANAMDTIAATMFSRWSQENYFKYMRENFGIDRLISYELEEMDGATEIVNPDYRNIGNKVRARAAKLSRLKVQYSDLAFQDDITDVAAESFIKKKSTVKEKIEDLSNEISSLKELKKKTSKKITLANLPDEEKFKQFKRGDKQFVDCIKMIAYRAETMMANLLREDILKKDEARSIVRQILMSDADITPDESGKRLCVKLHGLTNPRNSKYAKKLCELLNATETCFPGTDLQLTYDLVSN